MTGIRLSIALGAVLAILCSTALGGKPFTQSGTFVYTAQYPKPFPNIDVNFAERFGGTPMVSLTYTGENPILRDLPWQVSAVTDNGFSVTIDALPSQFVGTPIQLNWTATGPVMQKG